MNKKYLNIMCTQEEADSLSLIINKISCASQAARVDAIPDGIDENKARIFIQAAIESLGNYKWLEEDWWKKAKKTYSLPENEIVYIDFADNQFYTIGDN